MTAPVACLLEGNKYRDQAAAFANWPQRLAYHGAECPLGIGRFHGMSRCARGGKEISDLDGPVGRVDVAGDLSGDRDRYSIGSGVLSVENDGGFVLAST